MPVLLATVLTASWLSYSHLPLLITCFCVSPGTWLLVCFFLHHFLVFWLSDMIYGCYILLICSSFPFYTLFWHFLSWLIGFFLLFIAMTLLCNWRRSYLGIAIYDVGQNWQATICAHDYHFLFVFHHLSYFFIFAVFISFFFFILFYFFIYLFIFLFIY